MPIGGSVTTSRESRLGSKGPAAARRSNAPIIPNATFTIANGSGSLSRDTFDAPAARDIQLAVNGRDEPVALLLGRNQVGGKWTRALNFNGRLLLPVLWGRGVIDAVESVTLGGQPFQTGLSFVTHYLGDQTSPDPKLVSAFSSIGVTWNAPLTGIAYSVFDIVPFGIFGDPLAIIRGLRAFDPRNGSHVFANPATWAYTTNPVLLTARIMTDQNFGLGVVPGADFWASVTAAANRCDEIVSGTTRRRTLNYVLQQQQSAADAIKQLASFCGCWIVPEGASYRFILDAPTSPSASVNEADMIQGSFSYQGKSTLSRPNTVFVRYTEPTASGLWVSRLAPRGADVPATPVGETYRAVTIERPEINSYQEALRGAQEYRGHAYLEDLSMSWRQTAKALSYQVGDVVNVTRQNLFTNKPMRIMSIALASPDRWQIEADEYDPAAYSNSFINAPTYPDSGLPSPLAAPPAPTNLVLTETLVQGITPSSATSRITATITASTGPFVDRYRWIVRDSAGVVVDVREAPGLSYTSPALPSPAYYTVSVQALNSIYDTPSVELTGRILLSETSQVTAVFKTFTLTGPGTFFDKGKDQNDNPVQSVVFVSGSNDLAFQTPEFSENGPSQATNIHPTPVVLSKVFDLGHVVEVEISIKKIIDQLAAYKDRLFFYISVAGESGIFGVPGPGETLKQELGFAGKAWITARYFVLEIRGADAGSFENQSVQMYNWKLDFTGAVIEARAYEYAETVRPRPTTLTTGTTTVVTSGQYIEFLSALATADSTDFANVVTSSPRCVRGTQARINIDALNAAQARVARAVNVEFRGFKSVNRFTNWALAANGATASATTFTAGYPASEAINGSRSRIGVIGTGFWNSNGALTQTHTVTFATPRSISRLVIVGLQDNFSTPAEPSVDLVGTLYQLQSYRLGIRVAGVWSYPVGVITGNTRIMRIHDFALTAAVEAISCDVIATPDSVARIVQFEGWGPTP